MNKLVGILVLSFASFGLFSCGHGCPGAGCPSDEPPEQVLIPANQNFKNNVLDNEELINFALVVDSILEGEWEFTHALDTAGNALAKNEFVKNPTITFRHADSLNPASYRLNDGCNDNGRGLYELDGFDSTLAFSDGDNTTTLMDCFPKVEPKPEDLYSLQSISDYSFNFTFSESSDTLTLENPQPDSSRVSSLTFIRQK